MSIGVVSSGLPLSQFHSSSPVRMSKARITPDGDWIEKLSFTAPPMMILPATATGGEVE